jgi:RNA polymerase sigma factor (TIGR02999 family)
MARSVQPRQFRAKIWRMHIDNVFVELIAELRQIAHSARARVRGAHTLMTTALVNEAYLKLKRSSSGQALDQAHFFALAARAMREVLIDDARRRQTRASVDAHSSVESETPLSDIDPVTLIAIDQRLQELAEVNPRLVDVVSCRFFAGYSEQETADILKVDVRTVQRDWQRARALISLQD